MQAAALDAKFIAAQEQISTRRSLQAFLGREARALRRPLRNSLLLHAAIVAVSNTDCRVQSNEVLKLEWAVKRRLGVK